MHHAIRRDTYGSIYVMYQWYMDMVNGYMNKCLQIQIQIRLKFTVTRNSVFYLQTQDMVQCILSGKTSPATDMILTVQFLYWMNEVSCGSLLDNTLEQSLFWSKSENDSKLSLKHMRLFKYMGEFFVIGYFVYVKHQEMIWDIHINIPVNTSCKL